MDSLPTGTVPAISVIGTIIVSVVSGVFYLGRKIGIFEATISTKIEGIQDNVSTRFQSVDSSIRELKQDVRMLQKRVDGLSWSHQAYAQGRNLTIEQSDPKERVLRHPDQGSRNIVVPKSYSVH